MPKKIFDIIPPWVINENKSLSIQKNTIKKDKDKKIKKEIFGNDKIFQKETESSEKKIKKFYSGTKQGAKILISFFCGLVLITIIYIVHFKFSKVEIEIWPKTETLNLEEKFTIDTNTQEQNFLTKIIPGKFFEIERNISQQYPCSGKTVKEEKAKGIIRVTNNYHLNQTLKKATRFQPPLENKKILYFRSIKTVTVPAKKYLDVEVIADEPGEEYNIKPSVFVLPGLVGLPQYYSITGKSFSMMKGGLKSEIPQVTKEDLEKAKKDLLKKLEEDNNNFLKTKIPEDFIFVENAVIQDIVETTDSAVESDPKFFNFNLKTKIKTIIFKKSDLDIFINKILEQYLEKNKNLQKEIKSDYSIKSLEIEQGKMILNLKISVKIFQDINLENLKKNLSGKTFKNADLFLTDQSKIDKFDFKFFPFWLNKIPQNFEIKILTN